MESELKVYNLIQFISKYSIPLFFLLSYIISWTSWLFNPWLLDRYQSFLQGDTPIIVIGEIPLVFRIFFIISSITGLFGPAIAATILTILIDGKTGLRKLFAKLLKWHTQPSILLILVLAPLVIQFISPVGIGLLTGSSLPDLSRYGIISLLGAFLQFLIINGGQEELGFRGFAQEKLQSKFGLLKTSVIIGVFWFFWHLPLYVWISGASQFGDNLVLGLCHQIAVCFVFTWIYYRTQSVLMAMILHAIVNFIGSIFDVELVSNSIALVSLIVRIGIYSLIGLLLICRFKSKNIIDFHTRTTIN